MSLKKAISYNKSQAAKFEWDPSWFDCTTFDEQLIENIKAFQLEHGLAGDGLCGPSTYRRAWTERDSLGDYNADQVISPGQKYIVHNANPFPIKWDKVVLWKQPGGLSAKAGNYSLYAGKEDRKPGFFVTHWDVCLSSKSCASVLDKRGISIHFCIDNDGTIYQLMDTQNVAWHAGGRSWNHNSVGVEVADAYYPKYQSWYEKNGFGPRPVWSGKKVHGRSMDPFLGFYDVQIEALGALWEAISTACGIPLEIPETDSAVDPACEANTFKGFCCHYHLTRRKIDCGGLDMQAVLESAEGLRD
jgi:hypothetical protein